MITTVQQSYIEEYAYLPEHIVPYVTSISQAEPFLLEDFLLYARKDHLIFVGYPLKEPSEEKRMKKVLDQAVRRFKPKEIALTAPSISSSIAGKACPPRIGGWGASLSHGCRKRGSECSLNRSGNTVPC